jgi:hypothetical protein
MSSSVTLYTTVCSENRIAADPFGIAIAIAIGGYLLPDIMRFVQRGDYYEVRSENLFLS